MNKLQSLLKASKGFVGKHSPGIMMGIGLIGVVSTVVLTAKATPKAVQLLEEEKRRRNEELEENEEPIEELPKLDVVKVVWKCYIPVAISGVLSIACILGANSVHTKRNAALATAYTLSETAFATYKDKVIETIGEKKEKEIQDKVAKTYIDRKPASNAEVILTERGNTLCYDAVSGRYFRSDIDKIKRAEIAMNQKLINEMYISLNEFYYELNLRPIEAGNQLGWNINDGTFDIHYSSQLTDDGEPCLVVNYHVGPRFSYSEYR